MLSFVVVNNKKYFNMEHVSEQKRDFDYEGIKNHISKLTLQEAIESAIGYCLQLGIPSNSLVQVFFDLGLDGEHLDTILTERKLEFIGTFFKHDLTVLRQSIFDRIEQVKLELLEEGFSEEDIENTLRINIKKSKINFF